MPSLKDMLEGGGDLLQNKVPYQKESIENQFANAKTNAVEDITPQKTESFKEADPLFKRTGNHTVYTLVSVFTGLIRTIFKGIDDFKWTENESLSKVVITNVFGDNRQDEDYPLVLVEYGALSSSEMGIGGSSIGGSVRHPSYLPGKKRYESKITKRQNTSITIRIIAESSKACVDMATIIYDAIIALKPMLSHDFKIENINNVSMTPIQPIETKLGKMQQTAVQMGVIFQRDLTVRHYSEWFAQFKNEIIIPNN